MTKTTTVVTKKPKRAKSTVRHTRAIAHDRTKRTISAPPDEVLVARLQEIVHPATLQQTSFFYALGLRERVLTLPIMVGLVLGMLWGNWGASVN